MKVRIFNIEEDKERTITIPTGFLFSRLGMYFGAKMMSRQARKEYEKKLNELWKNGVPDVDDLIGMDDMQAAERLKPPITEEQAKELFTALRDSKYLMGGLPLLSIEAEEGVRVRIDL